MSRLIDADKLPEHKFTRESAKGSDYMRGWNDAIDAIIDNAPTVEYPEQITVECDTEEDKQKLLSALRNARVTRVVEEERPQGEWIPVSKNMPNENGRYLITQGDFRFKTIIIKYYDLGKKEFGTWHELPFDDDEEVWIPISDVIAWMPLPEAYKEEAEK